MNKKLEHSKLTLGEEINMETNVATINELDYELSRLLNQPTSSKLSKIRKSTNVNSFKGKDNIFSCYGLLPCLNNYIFQKKFRYEKNRIYQISTQYPKRSTDSIKNDYNSPLCSS